MPNWTIVPLIAFVISTLIYCLASFDEEFKDESNFGMSTAAFAVSGVILLILFGIGSCTFAEVDEKHMTINNHRIYASDNRNYVVTEVMTDGNGFTATYSRLFVEVKPGKFVPKMFDPGMVKIKMQDAAIPQYKTFGRRRITRGFYNGWNFGFGKPDTSYKADWYEVILPIGAVR